METSSPAVTSHEDFKRSHLDTERLCQEEGFAFIPVVAEAVGGAWGLSAVKVFVSLAKDKFNATGEAKNTILRQLYQHLGILLHRANARAVLRRCMPRSAAVYPVLSVAAELQCPAAGAGGL